MSNGGIGRNLSLLDEEFSHLIAQDIKEYCENRETNNRVLLFPPVSNFRRFIIHKTCENIAHEITDQGRPVTFSIGEGNRRSTVVCFEHQIIDRSFLDNKNTKTQSATSSSSKFYKEKSWRNSDWDRYEMGRGDTNESFDITASNVGKYKNPEHYRSPSNRRSSSTTKIKPDSDDFLVNNRKPEFSDDETKSNSPGAILKNDKFDYNDSTTSNPLIVPRKRERRPDRAVYVPKGRRSLDPTSSNNPPVPAETEVPNQKSTKNNINTSSKLEIENSTETIELVKEPAEAPIFTVKELPTEAKVIEPIKSSINVHKTPKLDNSNTMDSSTQKCSKVEKKQENKPSNNVSKNHEQIVTNGDDGETEDWDALYDDNGECLDPKFMNDLTTAVGNVMIEKPKMDYSIYETKVNILNGEEFPHVLEISNFPAEFKTQDLMMIFSSYKASGFDIKWVDDTHALVCFSNSKIAAEVLAMNHPFVHLKPLAKAAPESRNKAKKCSSALQPYRARPETCAVLARRLVSGALGLRITTSREELENERKILKEAKARKLLAAKQREEMWDG